MSSQPIAGIQRSQPQATPAAASCRIVLPKTEFRLSPRVFTLEGFRAWATSDESPDKARVTFVDGEVVIDMGGEDIHTHVMVKTAVSYRLIQVNEGDDLGMFFVDGGLLSNVEANVSNIPDAVFATWETLESERLRLVRDENNPNHVRELEGTPDWVMEIVSDSSVGKDTRGLFTAYHRAGIPEYWLIDARGEEVRFAILLSQRGGYVPAPRRGGWQRSPVFNRRFRLVGDRGRLGLWRYTLEVKPGR